MQFESFCRRAAVRSSLLSAEKEAVVRTQPGGGPEAAQGNNELNRTHGLADTTLYRLDSDSGPNFWGRQVTETVNIVNTMEKTKHKTGKKSKISQALTKKQGAVAEQVRRRAYAAACRHFEADVAADLTAWCLDVWVSGV